MASASNIRLLHFLQCLVVLQRRILLVQIVFRRPLGLVAHVHDEVEGVLVVGRGQERGPAPRFQSGRVI